MAYDIQWQMGCCLCCGGPIEPSREALRRDCVGSRALNYIEGDAIQHKVLWDLDGDAQPTLFSAREKCHLFHTTNVQSAMHALLEGRLKDVWLDSDTPQYDASEFRQGSGDRRVSYQPPARGNGIDVPSDMYIIGVRRTVKADTDEEGREKTPFRAVAWKKPPKLEGFEPLQNLIFECLTRVEGSLVVRPMLEHCAQGCKMCNNIMTMQATSAHFLVRTSNWTPLIEDRKIMSCRMKNQTQFFGTARFDPSDETRNKVQAQFSYEACIAYYIHRCLPKKYKAGRESINEREYQSKLLEETRYVCVFFSFIVLEIACLNFERFKGMEGGTKKRTKPAYRYRGCAETYLAYLYWVLLQNDNPEGTGIDRDQKRCSMEFYKFHRYFFTEVLETLVLAVPDLAWACELNDVVFENIQDFGDTTTRADDIIGNICRDIVKFYEEYLRPYFSRHLASLTPDPHMDGPMYHALVLVGERLIHTHDLLAVMHMLERATPGDIDTFINSTGVTSVFAPWRRYLAIATCTSTVRLTDQFMDALVLVEYGNIAAAMSANPEMPTVSPSVAEAVFLMCYALELPSEPSTEEELQLLRIAPKCSPVKGVPREGALGGFSEDPLVPSRKQVGAAFSSLAGGSGASSR